MKRTTIDYGIDLGTTNSAIARMEQGTLKIIKSEEQADTMPSCVSFGKKSSVRVGSAAYRKLEMDLAKALSKNTEVHSFAEFKRTMGTDETYHSSNMDTPLTSEELSAHVLTQLKSFVIDESVNSAVITIPAAYTINQIDAVKRAANIAGLQGVQVLQEPVAAAMACGINKRSEGYSLIFDFGGGTFDSALIKTDEGLVNVVDTEGNNHLGGKDLDYAIVDNIIIPHIAENFEISDMLADSESSNKLRYAYKFLSENIKNSLSFKSEHELYVDPGDAGEDDEGEEIEIDLTISQQDLKQCIEPIFQKAIDISLGLLARNNLSGNELSTVILVGGPTLSPILREMISKQLCTPDTSVDPMTIVAQGAAVYASTIQLADDIIESQRDKSKIQLQIDFEASTVEQDEFVTFKVLPEKSDGEIPSDLFVQLTNAEHGWVSPKSPIDEVGEVIDVQLKESCTNNITVDLFDSEGNRYECEPNKFSIIQGSVLGGMTLPKSFGIEIRNENTEKAVFYQLKGLEKNRSIPSTGESKVLSTAQDIRPGVTSDIIKIPLYQGEHDSEGTSAIHNEHVYDVIISGADLPKMLPKGSSVEISVSINQQQDISFSVFIPYLEESIVVNVPTNNVQSVSGHDISQRVNDAIDDISLSELDNSEKERLISELTDSAESLNKNVDDTDTTIKARDALRKVLREFETLDSRSDWEKVAIKLTDTLNKLESANTEMGDDSSKAQLTQYQQDVQHVMETQDFKLAKSLSDEMFSAYMDLTMHYQLINLINYYNDSFARHNWLNTTKARSAVDDGIGLIEQGASVNELRDAYLQISNLLPQDEATQSHNDLLLG